MTRGIETSSSHRKEDIIDSFLLLFLSLLTLVFLSPSITKGEKGISFLYNESLPLYVLIPSYVLFIVASFFFIHSRKKVSGERISPLLLSFYGVFLLFRAISLFSFPYGEISYEIHVLDQTGSFLYPGFAIGERFLSFFNDVFLGLFYLLFFSYLKTFSSSFMEKTTRYLSCLLEIIVITMVLYSFLKEGSGYVHNFEVLFLGKQDEELNLGICSYTSYRNVYGFFLLLGNLVAQSEMFRKPNLFYLFLIPITLFVSFLVFSRTPFLLSAASDTVFVVLFTVFNGRKYKKQNILGLSISFAFVILLIVFAIINPGMFAYWDSLLSNNSSLQGRRGHILFSLAFLTYSPYTFCFGYNLRPYQAILIQAKTEAIPYEVLPYSHLIYLDMLLEWGLFVFFLFVYIYLFFFASTLHSIIKRKNINLLGYFLFLLVSMVYGFFEPRGWMMNDNSTILFTFFLLTPLTYYTKDYLQTLEDIFDNILFDLSRYKEHKKLKKEIE